MSESESAEREVRDRIKRIIVQRLRFEGLDPATIVDDEPLFGEGLGLDSVDALELVVALEGEFGIKVQSHEAGREAFASVAALARYVIARRAAAPAENG